MPLGNNICETTMTPSKQCADLFPQRLCIILNFEGSHLRSGCIQGHIYICASLHYKVAARFHLFTVHMRSLGAICASLENHHGEMAWVIRIQIISECRRCFIQRDLVAHAVALWPRVVRAHALLYLTTSNIWRWANTPHAKTAQSSLCNKSQTCIFDPSTYITFLRNI